MLSLFFVKVHILVWVNSLLSIEHTLNFQNLSFYIDTVSNTGVSGIFSEEPCTVTVILQKMPHFQAAQNTTILQ